MTPNIGRVDRIIRLILGVALIALALGYFPGMTQQFWGWIGIIPLVTAFVGTCPAYSLLGTTTCKRV
jgi:Protein of unknown function (DUF2892)